jgi:type VI secretion system secreted protein VgrG
MRDPFEITCSTLPESTRVAGFRGAEGISRLYAFEVFLLLGAEGQDLDMADTVGAKAELSIDRADGRPPFVFHGIFAAFELLHEMGDRTLFHATLVPQLWQLTQTFHSRIYTGKSIPDILQAVLEDGGLSSSDYRLDLAQSYKPEEHVCQYMESDLDFIARWMEREGMYYYFEQGDSSEKLVITDSKSFQAPLPDKPVRFFALGGHDASAGEALHTFACKYRALPASYKLKDYDYTKPALGVTGGAPVSKTGLGEISVYGHRFFTPDDGKRLAKLRAEELLARQVVYQGAGTAFYMRPGYLFTLKEHPREAFNAEYLVTETEHVGNLAVGDEHLRSLTGIEGNRVYWVEVTAIPSAVQHRAERRTAWPRIYGHENGVVDGPAESEYAQIDENGRYNVKFKFDESDLKNGKASTFVRMMQPHGGNPEGFHFPLRKGTEVLFTFLGGDPDRPVISGVVPNLITPSPVVDKNYTQNVIQTGGLNRYEMEDLSGSQYIDISTPPEKTFLHLGAPHGPCQHNWILSTNGNGLINTGGDRNITVAGVQTEDVKGDLTEDYHANQTTHVYSAFKETIDAGATQTISAGSTQTITGGETRTVSGGMTETINGGRTQTINGGSTETVVGSVTQTVSAGVTHLVGGAVSEIIGGSVTQNIGGAVTQIYGSSVTQIAAGPITMVAPAVTQIETGPKSLFTNGSKFSLTYGLSFSFDASASLSLFIGVKLSAELSLKISATAGFKADFGSATNLRAAPTDVTVGAAVTSITGGTLVDVVTPCLMVPAASIVLL